jgi:hypothetical protein
MELGLFTKFLLSLETNSQFLGCFEGSFEVDESVVLEVSLEDLCVEDYMQFDLILEDNLGIVSEFSYYIEITDLVVPTFYLPIDISSLEFGSLQNIMYSIEVDLDQCSDNPVETH